MALRDKAVFTRIKEIDRAESTSKGADIIGLPVPSNY
jgi:hypothetical protein